MCSYRLPVIIMLIILSIDMYFTFFDSISWKITVLSFNVWAYTLLNKIKIIKKITDAFSTLLQAWAYLTFINDRK